MRFGWLTLSLSPSPQEDAARTNQQISRCASPKSSGACRSAMASQGRLRVFAVMLSERRHQLPRVGHCFQPTDRR
jgi:hypothetical protein